MADQLIKQKGAPLGTPFYYGGDGLCLYAGDIDLVLGASPPDKSHAYALLKNDSLNHFYLAVLGTVAFDPVLNI